LKVQQSISFGYGPTPQSIVKYNTQYPNTKCRAPVADQIGSNIASESLNERIGLYAPFKSKKDWEIAQWAKL